MNQNFDFQYRLEKSFTEVGYIFIEDEISNIKSKRAKWVKTYIINKEVNNRTCKIRLALSKDFPIEKPFYFLENLDDLPFMPHIEKEDSLICYTFDDGLILDYDLPINIILESLSLAIETINSNMGKSRFKEFQKEFEINWSRLEDVSILHSYLDDRDTEYKQIEVLKTKSYIEQEVNILFDPQKHELSYLTKLYNLNLELSEKFQAIFIPFRKNSNVPFPYRYKMWNFKELKRIIYSNISTSIKRKLNALKVEEKGFYLILSIPFNDQRINISVFVKPNLKNEKKVVFNRIPNSAKLLPFSFIRLNSHFLLNRTQGNNNYEDYRVLVLGLGAVGSNIIGNLAKVGVKKFILVDKDLILPENSRRHYLGLHDILEGGVYKTKTSALEEYLVCNYPEINVVTYRKDVKEFFEEDLLGLNESFDLIVSALGSPTNELYLNELVYKKSLKVPVIYSWLDPLGIGSHVLITNNFSKRGCFRCLYTDNNDPNYLINNRASFVNPTDKYQITMLGCHSEFTPYSYLDAQECSIYTTRIILKVLQKRITGNQLFSIIGDDEQVRILGFEPSLRYKYISQNTMKFQESSFFQNNCIICGEHNDI